ncbi:MAG: lipopolysaccharide assembly protein LapA domain-containing protein [Neisseria sp.]|nr:lipopolysaccharide assembly protein LapA domain-containing protein [Neisseria sp.]
MKFIYLIIKILILLLLLVLAVSNTQSTAFFYLPGQQIDLPLIAILFVAFVVGTIFGILAMFGRLLRLRAENNRLRSEVKKTARLNEQDLQVQTADAAKK